MNHSSSPHMDLTTAQTPSPTLTKTPDTENDTPPQAQPIKPLSFSNGVLKKHQHYQPSSAPGVAVVVTYKECLKNHAASMGGHALDGCGEFMPSPTANERDPTSLKCAACGCHRNFHRRETPDDSLRSTTHFLDFRHQRQPGRSSPPSPSPPPPPQPFSSFAAAPHMLLALRNTGMPEDHQTLYLHQVASPLTPTGLKTDHSSGRKRFRTKFSQEQKEKMHSFSEKLGWKMQKSDDAVVEEFCNEIGVAKGVLKVWMHNNKNTFGKKLDINNTTTTPGINTEGRAGFDHNINGNGSGNDDNTGGDSGNQNEADAAAINPHISANASSSSS